MPGRILHADALDRGSTVAVDQHRFLPAVAPILAPLAKSQDNGKQGFTFFGQRIDDLAPVAGVRCASEDPTRDQLGQSIGKDIAGNPQTGLEFLKVSKAVEGPAKDEEGPFFADQLDRGRQWAAQRSGLERVNVGNWMSHKRVHSS